MAISVSPNGKNHYETSAPADEVLVATPAGRSGPSRLRPTRAT